MLWLLQTKHQAPTLAHLSTISERQRLLPLPSCPISRTKNEPKQAIAEINSKQIQLTDVRTRQMSELKGISIRIAAIRMCRQHQIIYILCSQNLLQDFKMPSYIMASMSSTFTSQATRYA